MLATPSEAQTQPRLGGSLNYILRLLRGGNWIIIGHRVQFCRTGEGFPIDAEAVEALKPYLTGGMDPLLKVNIYKAAEVVQ